MICCNHTVVAAARVKKGQNMDESLRKKVDAVRVEVADSNLDPDRKVVLQGLLDGADRCLEAVTEEEKLNALVSGQGDVMAHLAREGVRTESVMNRKIEECRAVGHCSFPPALAVTVITVAGMLCALVMTWMSKG